ncbi:MAG TPA: maleylpyruvate isomerase family mycothiol-dependent enzyme [Streptosporangiaceae bacterium]|nr:maleylpyruvate isomerase family mycothiol-dependent enzyme [Streptosporangiaceae bacterium]
MMELIAANRRALADALSDLSADQWHGASLCAGWTPAHVLAHQTMPFRISAAEVMAGIQQCGGDFTKYSDEVAERDSQIPAAELVAILRENAENPWAPPGGGLAGALSHDVIHGLDSTWVAGPRYDIPVEAMTMVLGMITAPLALPDHAAVAADVQPGAEHTTLFGFPLDGIKVSATDLDWSTGQGAELRGRARDLLPLLAGRKIGREMFSGPGADRAWSLAAD